MIPRKLVHDEVVEHSTLSADCRSAYNALEDDCPIRLNLIFAKWLKYDA
jgi:hypothetical protein